MLYLYMLHSLTYVCNWVYFVTIINKITWRFFFNFELYCVDCEWVTIWKWRNEMKKAISMYFILWNNAQLWYLVEDSFNLLNVSN